MPEANAGVLTEQIAIPKALSLPVKVLFISIGSVSLALGVTAIFVPGLPSTPFLLLTVWLYTRSSSRLLRWLSSIPFLKKELHAIQTRKGLTMRAKVFILVFALAGLSAGAYFINRPWVTAAFGLLYLIKLLVFIQVVKTVSEE